MENLLFQQSAQDSAVEGPKETSKLNINEFHNFWHLTITIFFKVRHNQRRK